MRLLKTIEKKLFDVLYGQSSIQYLKCLQAGHVDEGTSLPLVFLQASPVPSRAEHPRANDSTIVNIYLSLRLRCRYLSQMVLALVDNTIHSLSRPFLGEYVFKFCRFHLLVATTVLCVTIDDKLQVISQ